MNTQLIVLTCTMTAIACACSSTPPAHDATSSTAAATADQSSSTTFSRPAAETSQPVAATMDRTVELTASSDSKSPAASQYVGTKPATPQGDANPGVADERKEADNTKVNTRDRHASLTPMDQGNSAAETKITADIRKGIMGDKTVSFTGKNVKVVTVGTRVTLRGPVKSDKERSAIEAIAKRTAGVSDVDNQLEIAN